MREAPNHAWRPGVARPVTLILIHTGMLSATVIAFFCVCHHQLCNWVRGFETHGERGLGGGADGGGGGGSAALLLEMAGAIYDSCGCGRAEDRRSPGKQTPGRGATRVRAGSLFWSCAHGPRLKDSKNQRSNPTSLSYPRLVICIAQKWRVSSPSIWRPPCPACTKLKKARHGCQIHC